MNSVRRSRFRRRSMRSISMPLRRTSLTSVMRIVTSSGASTYLTISTYRARVMEKMRMKTNSELTCYALQNQLVD
jgi:hypothetical protein